MSGFTVAKASAATQESANELATLIANASGANVQRLPLTELAGPNHAIQLLADIPTWTIVVATFLGSNVIQGFISQFGAEAATKLISRFKASPKLEGNSKVVDAEAVADAIAHVAIGNKDKQSLTIGVQVHTIVARNLGIDVSKLLTGEAESDRLILLRSAVALVEVAKRIQRGNLLATAPQNRDASVSINIDDDGSFGGVYSFLSRPPSNLDGEQVLQAGYYPAGRYQITLKFDASGDCIEDHLERISDY